MVTIDIHFEWAVPIANTDWSCTFCSCGQQIVTSYKSQQNIFQLTDIILT